MSANTPPLSPDEKKEYIECHLFNELRWLLGAATEWFVQEQLQMRIVGCDVVVYAMDSSFAHARSLFEFFVVKATQNHYSVTEFIGGSAPLLSPSYDDWKEPLHQYFIHAQTRSTPRLLMSSGSPKDLNKMPVEFANEVLRLWKEFEDRLSKSSDPVHHELSKVAREKREEAIKDASCVVDSTVTKLGAEVKGLTLKPIFIVT